MDATPHTHTPRIIRQYPYSVAGAYRLQYGDTIMHLCSEWRKPSKRDINRVLAKVIKQHDKGSLEAIEKEKRKQEQLQVAHSIFSVISDSRGKWGTEVLAEIKKSKC